MTTEEKPEISQVEGSEVHAHHKHLTIEELAENEDEPQTPYQLGWRTILCVITLSMGNVCAALANTVSSISNALLQTDFRDQYDYQIPSSDSRKILRRCCTCFMDCKWQFPRCSCCGTYLCKFGAISLSWHTLISLGLSR